jgi:tripartite-type tricarboxylate transporter receptor subunit TctC
MRLLPRLGVAVFAAALLVEHSTLAQAQDWPSKPVKIVVPSAAGGSSDTITRLAANHFQHVFKQPFIIENRAGAGNSLGASYVAKQPPDGYTLLATTPASNLTVPLVSKNVDYDPVTDFTHIVMLSGSPYAIAVNPALGVKTLAEFVARGRAATTPLTYTAANPGGLGHMGGEYFKKLAKVEMVHIAYRGGGPAVADVVAGHVPMIMLPLSTIGQHVRTGKLTLLAVTSRRRVAAFPDVPTFSELGYPDLVFSSWFGLAGPKGFPPELAERINKEARELLQTPKMKELAEQEASEILDGGPAEFTKLIADDVARWTKAIAEAGLKLD